VDQYVTIPKVDLHRHLEGSLRLRTMSEVSRTLNLGLPQTGQLRTMVQINDDEPYTFENFLRKFETLRLFYRSPEIIARITREAIKDAALDGVRYLELRFTPVALSRAEKFDLGKVMDWVIAGMQQAVQETGIQVRLIASVNRHEGPEVAKQVVSLAADRRDRGLVGVDLAGNEAYYSCMPFDGVFRDAHSAGLHVTIHAGEWGGAQNVVEAIEFLGAERIGHGIRVMEDPRAVALARERGTVFEVCMTSNYQSGVIQNLAAHPLPAMLAAGLNVTINTDDPSISKICLSDEYRLAVETLGIPQQTLYALILNAARSSFLSEEGKRELISSL
jgi:adenosine deaminase